LRKLAILIGEVASVENAQTMSRRQGGPLINVRVKDVMKLPGTLVILLLHKNKTEVAYIDQVVNYSGLLGQCNRCRKFGHPTAECPLSVGNHLAGRKETIPAAEQE